jgi:PhoPQ-activated pathogenicity-related protein
VSLVAFYDSIVKGTKRPEYSWTFEKDGSIRVKCETPVKEVKLWYANNPKARDFRLESIGKAYQSISIEDKGNGVYIGKIEQPKSGWSAFFVELTHENGSTLPLKTTTAVRVLPEELPFKSIDPLKGPLEERSKK